MSYFILAVLLAILPSVVEGHGRLIEPAGRSTMWRYGFNTPVNFNDNQLFCGGFNVQWYQNGGKCGICGDSFENPEPREHEAGGKYAVGVISKRYRVNQNITVKVEITANHMGWFEFRLCPNNNLKKDPSQDCFDQYLLPLADGSGTRYPIPENFGYTGVAEIKLKLPKNLSCSQCILQWHYNTASSWGVCDDGFGTMGCGIQENFRGCADISILTLKTIN